MLDQITPLILTYNEARNIGRTLERLKWARDIVVVDSFSSDETMGIIARYPNARVVQRAFDNFAAQWTFAAKETGIATEWILALDADFLITDELREEFSALEPAEQTSGYKIPIAYCIHGRRLRSNLLPPLTLLYRRARCGFRADGHTYQLMLDGDVRILKTGIVHDDRKPLSRWLESQKQYAILEGNKLLDADRKTLTWPDRIRRLRVLAPVAVLFYCLVYRAGVLDGWPGVYYAFQRTFAELLLSRYLLENDLRLIGRRSGTTMPAKDQERRQDAAIAIEKQTV
jgi:glycosyltransferase involved in cell wall biosynthesis